MTEPSSPWPTRAVARSTRAMIATPHPLATAAGVDMLRRGGNAVDAAVAANAVLAVVYPASCGLGGDALWMVHDPVQRPTLDRRTVCYNGSGRTPRGAVAREAAAARCRCAARLAVTVPGAVRSWEDVVRRHGTRSLDELLVRGGRVRAQRVRGDRRRRRVLRAQRDAAARRRRGCAHLPRRRRPAGGRRAAQSGARRDDRGDSPRRRRRVLHGCDRGTDRRDASRARQRDDARGPRRAPDRDGAAAGPRMARRRDPGAPAEFAGRRAAADARDAAGRRRGRRSELDASGDRSAEARADDSRRANRRSGRRRAGIRRRARACAPAQAPRRDRSASAPPRAKAPSTAAIPSRSAPSTRTGWR